MGRAGGAGLGGGAAARGALRRRVWPICRGLPSSRFQRRRSSRETPCCREILLKVSPFWILTEVGRVGLDGVGDGAGVLAEAEGRRRISPG